MLLERLQNTLGLAREIVDGAPWTETHTRLYATQEEQVAAQRRLCDEMEQLMPAVVELGGYLPPNPRAMVKKRLALLAEES